MLARAGYAEGTKYTISTLEFGPLEPGDVDPTPYVEALMGGNFAKAEDAEAPDGEYVVLYFPEEGVRFDFFKGDGNLVRETRGEEETLYARVFPDPSVSNTDIMQGWYDALAEAAGKKDTDTSLDGFLGDWTEKNAGRGTVTISKGVAPGTAEVAVSWPDSSTVVETWTMTASLTEDGKLAYENGTWTVTEYDEDGNGSVLEESNNESGSFALTEDGELEWTYQEVSMFIPAAAE